MPVVLALLGHRDEARSFVEAKLEEFDGQTHLLAEYYRGFAATFLSDPPPTDASGQDADRGDEPG